jgi:GNAT superfamily N-acetyltransferase
MSRPGNPGAPDEVSPAPTITSHELKIPMTWTLRPISPADETALIEFHARCSEETHYLRFAAAKPQLRPAEAQYLCAVDDHGRAALVIIASDDPRTIHGVRRWERLKLTDAELSFVIEDAYQGQGLGRKLVEATIERAHEEGLTRLVTAVLPSKYRMGRLARDYELLAAML